MAPDQPAVVDVEAAAELSGARRSTCAALLRSPWLRRPGAPTDGLLLADVVLLAAAERFPMGRAERERLHARWCGDPRVEQPMTFARRRDGTVEIATGSESFEPIHLRARQRVTASFFSNDDLIVAFRRHVDGAS